MRRLAIILAAPMALAGCDFPASTYSIPSESMRPTLTEGMLVGGDHFKGDCGHAEPRPGDIVIHRRGDTYYVRRAVAGPGQTIAMAGGRLSIDGKPVEFQVVGPVPRGDVPGPGLAQVVRETLPNGAAYLTLDMGPHGDLDDVATTKVPAGSWYLLGDNRDNAADSRVDGPARAADICDRVTSIIWAKELSRVGKKP
jgi:signal peptidase I